MREGTRIETLTIDAGFILSAVRVKPAARGALVVFANLPKGTTCIGSTLGRRNFGDRSAIVKWISSVFGKTGTSRTMNNRLTVGICSTRRLNGAGIDAFRIDTCFVECTV